MKNLQIEYVNTGKLKYYPNNPRYWSEKQIENLTRSLEKYTLLQPLVVNSTKGRENIVLSGNFRLFIAKRLGYKTVPIIKVSIENPKIEQELVLRFNSNLGSWNFEILKEFKLDVILEAGFDENELNNIFDNNLSVEDDEFDEKTELKRSAKTTIKKGDLFALGPHRIYCADSHNLETVKKLTHFNDYDIKFPGYDNEQIIFERAGELHTYNINVNCSR